MISIITPTYNRAHLIDRVFNSLQKQTNKNFEWLIIDDGSSDNTSEVVNTFTSTDFNIHYHKKENGGKHTALNYGISRVKGDYILIVDTDDYLTENAIAFINSKVKLINEKEVCGIAGRRIDEKGEVVGTSNFIHKRCNSLDIRYKYNVTGDLVEVFKTEILKEFPFPEIKNEKFCPEALVWNRIAQEYKIDFYNEGFYVTEYLPGGLTDRITKIRMNSPKASMIHYSELASYNIPLKEKLKAIINFWRFSFNDKGWSFKEKYNKVNKLYSLFCLPLGFLMYINDKRKI